MSWMTSDGRSGRYTAANNELSCSGMLLEPCKENNFWIKWINSLCPKCSLISMFTWWCRCCWNLVLSFDIWTWARDWCRSSPVLVEWCHSNVAQTSSQTSWVWDLAFLDFPIHFSYFPRAKPHFPKFPKMFFVNLNILFEIFKSKYLILSWEF
jgi:hypothetical protein